MFAVASRHDMKIGVVARGCLRLHRIVLVVRSQLLDAVIDVLANKIALLQPSCRACGGAHFDEAAIMIENLDAVPILHHAGLLIHCGNLVAQVRLDGGNVGDLEDSATSAVAGRKEYRAGEA